MKSPQLLLLLPLLLLVQACSIEVPFTKKTSPTTTPVHTTTPTPPTVQTGGLLNVLNTNTAPSSQTESTPILASRAADGGCSWKKVTEEALGVSVLEMICEKTNNALPYTFKGNKLLNADGSADQYPVLTVFYKQGEETNKEVLQRLFLSKLDSKAQADCTIKQEPTSTPSETKERLIITLTDKASEELRKNDEPYFGTCGDFGQNGARTYFEFAKGMKKFLFVNGGQDTVPIDFESIIITK